MGASVYGKMPQALESHERKEFDIKFQPSYSKGLFIYLFIFAHHISISKVVYGWENKLELLGFMFKAFLLNSVCCIAIIINITLKIGWVDN